MHKKRSCRSAPGNEVKHPLIGLQLAAAAWDKNIVLFDAAVYGTIPVYSSLIKEGIAELNPIVEF
ncbi:hypothetical protein ACWGJQ_00290 [Peribacillus simplex]